MAVDHPMSIDVVIPTFNGWTHTERCLRHLRAQTVAHQVIVSDNGSTDGTQERIREEFPEVRLVQGVGNPGFPYACNRGAEAGRGDVIVLLNNDVDARPDFLERLIAPFATDERIGSIASTLLAADGREIDSVGLSADVTLAGWPRLRGQPATHADQPSPRLLGPSGGAGAYRRRAWEEVGGLDEGVRFYSEDVELALRLRASGWRAAAAPDAVAVHVGSATIGIRSAAQREASGFARAYFMGRYGVLRSSAAPRALVTELIVASADAVLHRDLAALRGRIRGLRASRRMPRQPMPPSDAREPQIGFFQSLWMRWQDVRIRQPLPSPRLAGERPSEIWILDDGLIMGGGQRFALRLLRVLDRSDIPVRLLAPANSQLAAEAERRGHRVVDARYPRLLPPAVSRIPFALWRLRRELAQVHPDTMVIGNTARCQGYATAVLFTLRRWPIVVHLMHEQDSAHRLSARTVYRRIGSLVAVGENSAAVYRERLPGVPVTSVSNFLDVDEMQRIEEARTASPAGPRPVVGVLGRLIPEKGILELAEELSAIPAAWERALIAAPPQDQAYARRLEARIRELGLGDRFELLGEVTDLDDFFARIDVLAVPSVGREGQPTVILEGLLYGRPVIVRAPVWSSRYADLPVLPYRTADELESLLAALPEVALTATDLEAHFGADGLVQTLRTIAEASPQLAGPTR